MANDLTIFKAVDQEQNGTTSEGVVGRFRELIQRGELRPGDRLPPERDLSKMFGVSRPTLRAGIRSLAALHNFTSEEMFEARLALEMNVAGLAAERASGEQLALMSEEIAEMYASLDNPVQYLVHDMRFHQAIAAASGNRILTALMNMVATILYDVRSNTVGRATDLQESAEMHREVYRAIRDHSPEAARQAMRDHLSLAQKAQAAELRENAEAAKEK